MLCCLKDKTAKIAPWIARDNEKHDLAGSTLSDLILGVASLLTFSSPQDALKYARDHISNVQHEECEVWKVEISGSKIEMTRIPEEEILHT